MLNLLDTNRQRPKCDGTSRREFFQVGSLAIGGLTLAQLLEARAHAPAAGQTVRRTSVILLFLDGGAPQHETFDPKIQVSESYRSVFGAIQTKLPGIALGSHFVNLAARTDRMSIIRTLVHGDGDHGGATHWMKTAHPWPPEALGKAATIPQQNPSIGSVVARARGPVNRDTGVPTYVRLLSNHGGFPGDDAVWLGQAHSPFRLRAGRTSDSPMLNNMALSIPRTQLDQRQLLLRSLDNFNRTLDSSGTATALDGFHRQAVDVVLGRARAAFDLDLETTSLRERYGPGLGQELLLARRLCEAGAGFVTINNGYWDFHGGLVSGCQRLCPPLDHAVSVFIDDVRQRGLENDILLVVTGEFGRTPRVGNGRDAGRDHWAPLNDALLIGGGLNMGQVIGESDARGGHVRSRPVTPGDLFSTLLHVLGIDPRIQFTHPTGRPMYMIDEGQPIGELI